MECRAKGKTRLAECNSAMPQIENLRYELRTAREDDRLTGVGQLSVLERGSFE